MSEDTGTTGLTPADKETADIKVNEIEENSDIEFEALFDEDVSEADLKGETEEEIVDDEKKPAEEKPADEKSETDKAATSEPKGDEDEKSSEKADTDPKLAGEEEKKEDPEKTEKVDYSKPPPEGYVPLPALKEARTINTNLKSQVGALQKTVELLQAQPKTGVETKSEDDGFADFKVKTQAEFNELVEDDVEEAVKYQNRLENYNQHQQKVQRQQQIELAEKQNVANAIDRSMEMIAESVPGIYEEGNQIGSDLFEFAVANGFNQDYLSVLTTPATMITPVDQDGNASKKSYPLAGGAASMIKMLHALYRETKKQDPENLRETIKAEVEKDLREKITQELLEKFKAETTGQAFRSINEIPGGDDEELAHKKVYSEADFAKMSQKDQEKVLSGA